MTKIERKREEIIFDEAQEAQIEREEEIDREIKKLPREQSKLSYNQKRKLALKQLYKKEDIKEYLDLQNSTIILFNIEKIRREREKYIEKKISEIKDKKLTYIEKKLKVLRELNSSESYEFDENEEENEKKEGNDQDSKSYSNLNSTMDSSFKKVYYSYDSQKGKFWIDNMYYDISIDQKDMKKGLQKLYLKDKENNEYSSFLYDNNYNNTITYNLSLPKIFSEIFGGYKIPSIISNSEHFNDEYGLCFCGKEIKELKMKCSPNEMMCNECMKENLELYKLNKVKHSEHILININGRISIDNLSDRKYHCAGKFQVGKEIKNCLPDEFSCNACNLLNKNKNYYIKE